MSSLPLSDHDTLNLRLVEADLVTGAVALAELAVGGIPKGRRENFPEPPRVILDRLLATVSPDDLTRTGAGVWLRTIRAWNSKGAITWEAIASGAPPETRALLDWYRAHGLGLPLMAPVAARRLLHIATSLEEYRRSREVAAAAKEDITWALRGV